jgi:glutathione synthase/RimK-type ligase-like ATP-grasp enzyme
VRQAAGIGRLTTLSPRDAQRKLAEIEKRLARPPHAVEDLFARAQLFEMLGRNDDAREAYFALLSVAPSHFGGLNNLGNVLTRSGKRRAAQAAYEEAVRQHSQNPVGHVSLGICMLELEQFEGARHAFETALSLDATNAAAHKGLVYLFSRTGDEAAADRHRKLGFGAEPIEVLPYLGEGKPTEVLVLVSSTGGNLDAESLLDKHVFATTKLYIEYADPAKPLPRHDLIFNAISDADVAADALQRAREFATGAPLINAPHAVMPTGRADNAERLQSLQDVVAPHTCVIAREVLEREGTASLEALGFTFPVLLRLPRQHTGRHFVLVEKSDDLAAAIAQLPGDEFFVIEYLDARGVDGQARKYRVMFVDGKMYPLHLAVSPHWKIHYFSADMTENAANRAEDERFLADMHGALGPVAIAALERIERTLGLDYAGIDFAVDAQGRVLLFEANATMVVAQPGADARWDYRRPAVTAILNAFKDMVMGRVRV